ncbi:MAG: hypothetical protein ACE5IR_11765 [bacterium]
MKRHALKNSLFMGAMLASVFLSGAWTTREFISDKSDLNAALLPLVGKKCTVNLKDGDMIKGTLWDFGGHFLTLKVKKGLLYSKAERFKLSQIDNIQGIDGAIVIVSDLYPPDQSQETAKAKQEDSSPVYFKTGDIIPNQQRAEENIDNEYFSSASEKEEVPERVLREKSFQVLQSSPMPNEPGSRFQNSEQSDIQESIEQRSPAYNNYPSPDKGRKEFTFTQENPLRQNSEMHAPAIQKTKAKKTASVKPQTKGPPDVESDSQNLETLRSIRILKYQNGILFGIAILIVSLTIFFKAMGMRGKAYDKNSLFPAHLVQKSGQYGIIDHGLTDGVKVDDVLWLYSKNGQNIDFKGKMKVIKVAENYSAVAMVKKHSKDGDFEIGDVGFRDRNVLATSIKRTRLFIGGILGNTAKALASASKNLGVQKNIPPLDFQLTEDGPQNVRLEKEQKTKASQPRSGTPAPFIDIDEPEKMGFGLEDLMR